MVLLYQTAFAELYTLSLHDALPISARHVRRRALGPGAATAGAGARPLRDQAARLQLGRRRAHLRLGSPCRSEEHTSELQSQSNLVCRLLLEKKNYRF